MIDRTFVPDTMDRDRGHTEVPALSPRTLWVGMGIGTGTRVASLDFLAQAPTLFPPRNPVRKRGEGGNSRSNVPTPQSLLGIGTREPRSQRSSPRHPQEGCLTHSTSRCLHRSRSARAHIHTARLHTPRLDFTSVFGIASNASQRARAWTRQGRFGRIEPRRGSCHPSRPQPSQHLRNRRPSHQQLLPRSFPFEAPTRFRRVCGLSHLFACPDVPPRRVPPSTTPTH
jgi:hypothetical protein